MSDSIKNTMDDIVVKFKTADGIVSSKTLKEFLTLNFSLNKEDKRKKQAMAKLYKINGKEKLFDTFINPPILDLVTKISDIDKKKGKGGNYNPQNNTLIVENGRSIDLTVATIAHELKHAQQMSGDMYKIFTGEIKTSKREKLQLKFLTEAQAFAFGSYVYHKASSGDTHFMGDDKFYARNKHHFENIENILKINSKDDWKDIEGKLINAWLKVLYDGKAMHYRDHYLQGNSLDPNDKTLDHIPTSFHLSETTSEKDLLVKLAQAPLTPTKSEKKWLRMLLLNASQKDNDSISSNLSSKNTGKSLFSKWFKISSRL